MSWWHEFDFDPDCYGCCRLGVSLLSVKNSLGNKPIFRDMPLLSPLAMLRVCWC